MAGLEGDSEEPTLDFEVIIKPYAALDIAEITVQYEERSKASGESFENALDACLDVIARHPRIFAEVSKSVRRGLLRGFPYAIYYQTALDEKTIYVFACTHTSRSQKHWKERLKQDSRLNGKT